MVKKRFKTGLCVFALVLMIINSMSFGVMAEGVTTISDSSINQNNDFENIQTSSNDTDFDYIFSRGGVSITGYTGEGGDVVIPDILDEKQVMSIGDNAFEGCYKITTIKIPDSVVAIGFKAFSGCSGLTSIEIPNSVSSIDSQAFANCTGLSSVVIPNSITSMGAWVFKSCTGLTSIEIPESMTCIPHGIFEDCNRLSIIVIPNSVTSIEMAAFLSCTELKKIFIPDSVTSIEDYAFDDRISDLTLYGNTGSYIEDYATTNNFSFTINALTSIEITTLPVKTDYEVGESLDLTGMIVTASYNSGTQELIDVTTSNISGFSNISPEINQKLTVTINEKTAIFYVTITENNYSDSQMPTIEYQTHVQNEGWQNYVSSGVMSGTEGKSLRLEGIKIKLDTNDYDLGISYQTHIQNIGWEADTLGGWRSNDNMSGTEGLSYRLEAIQIKLTGNDSDEFDIYYRVHAQNFGWLDWAKNGDSSGTSGFGYRLEGIEIVILPRDTTAPGANDRPYVSNN